MSDETTLTPPSRIGRNGPHGDTEELVLAVVSRHAEGLLRLARRHSLCASDAEDAYQRGLEIFLKHAPRLDPERAPAWLRTVVKHEAMAVRRSRQRDLAPAQYDFDAVEASASPSPDEQVVIDALVAARTNHINDEVASGELTQEEADAKLAELSQRVTDMVNTKGVPPG